MKITIDIDMTPEELRQFMGLPDVSEVQETIMSKMKESVMDTMSEQGSTDAQKGLVEQSFKAMEAYQDMFKSMLEQAGKKKDV